MTDFNDLVLQASDILETVENYQFSLGEISQKIVEGYGYKALDEFSKEVERTNGVRRSASSLRIYAHVFKISKKLGLPRDILFSTCRDVIFSNDPVKYAKMAKEGYSGREIRKKIYEDEG
jgi:hypothetical protein